MINKNLVLNHEMVSKLSPSSFFYKYVNQLTWTHIFKEIWQSIRKVSHLHTIYGIYERKVNYTKVQNDLINIWFK